MASNESTSLKLNKYEQYNNADHKYDSIPYYQFNVILTFYEHCNVYTQTFTQAHTE
jgi:hypothetical protein